MHTETATTHETSSQPSNTDTIYNSVPTEAPATFTISAEEYALIEELKRERRERVLTERVKNHSKIFSSRRITVALRRVDLKDSAPDRDVLAYIEVCNLKSVAGLKAEASEEEMSAYLRLFDQGTDFPTLEAVHAAISN